MRKSNNHRHPFSSAGKKFTSTRGFAGERLANMPSSPCGRSAAGCGEQGNGAGGRAISRAAFTLIELLVVIAIIAILLPSESNFFMSVYVNGVLEKV